LNNIGLISSSTACLYKVNYFKTLLATRPNVLNVFLYSYMYLIPGYMLINYCFRRPQISLLHHIRLLFFSDNLFENQFFKIDFNGNNSYKIGGLIPIVTVGGWKVECDCEVHCVVVPAASASVAIDLPSRASTPYDSVYPHCFLLP
jgi:hypothetical protein